MIACWLPLKCINFLLHLNITKGLSTNGWQFTHQWKTTKFDAHDLISFDFLRQVYFTQVYLRSFSFRRRDEND